MKKIICICTIAISVVALSFAWCNRHTHYPLSQPQENIERIEIVEIADYRIISDGYFDGIVLKKVIDTTRHDSFLSAFYKLRCNKSAGPSQECIEGAAIKITYIDSAFEIITAESGFYYSANKERSYPAYYFNYDEFHYFVIERQGTGSAVDGFA